MKRATYTHQGVLLIESHGDNHHVHFFEDSEHWTVSGKTPNQTWCSHVIEECRCGAKNLK